MKRLLLPALLVCATANCVPVLVGGLIIHSSKSKEQHQDFMNQLQRTNADREAKGLKPLDWCSEAYRFDKGWAQQDTNCKKRIEAYDKGDVQALEAPVLTPAASDSVSSPGVPPASATTPPTNPGVDPPSRTWQAVGIQNCTVARFSYVLSPADTVVTVLPGQTVYQTVGEGNLLIAFDSSYADDLQKKTYLLKGAVGAGPLPSKAETPTYSFVAAPGNVVALYAGACP